MLATLVTAVISGLRGELIRVEVDVAPGLPVCHIVGLPDAALSEARERVRSAIRNSGFEYPLSRITVDLAPADRRKHGAAYDLAIAVGILVASGQILTTGGNTVNVEGSAGSKVMVADSPNRDLLTYISANTSFSAARLYDGRSATSYLRRIATGSYSGSSAVAGKADDGAYRSGAGKPEIHHHHYHLNAQETRKRARGQFQTSSTRPQTGT